MSADLHGSGKLRAPLVVLRVDDLDLNPEATLRLMELLRAVHSPHLMVIIAADHELLSTILRLKSRSELSENAAPLELKRHEPGDDLGTGARRRAEDLATDVLRKHFPLAQRVVTLVTIGSDDPLVFNSSLPMEYQLLFDTLVLAGLTDAEALEWLDKARQTGGSVDSPRGSRTPPTSSRLRTSRPWILRRFETRRHDGCGIAIRWSLFSSVASAAIPASPVRAAGCPGIRPPDRKVSRRGRSRVRPAGPRFRSSTAAENRRSPRASDR